MFSLFLYLNIVIINLSDLLYVLFRSRIGSTAKTSEEKTFYRSPLVL